MKYEVRISGKTYMVELERRSDGWQASIEGESETTADVAEIAPNVFSVLLSGRSHEVCVTPSVGGQLQLQTGGLEFVAEGIDPRSWCGRRHGGAEAEGRQQITAQLLGCV